MRAVARIASTAPPPAATGTRAEGIAGEPVIGLDLLRFAAAALVVVYHLACTAWLVPSSEAAGLVGQPIPFPDLLPLSAIGWIGVPIFFVISGYVIAASASRAMAGGFLLNRFLRLMPGIWICATVSFGLAIGFAPEPAGVLAARYLRTLVLFPVPRWIDGVYWTLGIEAAFYGLVYVLLGLRLSSRLEQVVLTLGIASALLWCMAASGVWPGLDTMISTRIAKLALVTHGCDFAIGLGLWSGGRNGWTPRRLAGLAICFVGALLQIRYDAGGVDAALGRETNLALPFAVFVGFLMLFCASVAGNAGVIARYRGLAPTLRQVGLLTYPLYLLHTFVGVLTMRFSAKLGLPPIACLVAGYASAITAALLVARHVEPPLRAVLRRSIERAQMPCLPHDAMAGIRGAAWLSRRRIARLSAAPHSPA